MQGRSMPASDGRVHRRRAWICVGQGDSGREFDDRFV
jgi:hypothetical protein